jgi:hypothetical protein
MSEFSRSKQIMARFNDPLRLTIRNGVLSTVPLPANHDKLSRQLNIQI